MRTRATSGSATSHPRALARSTSTWITSGDIRYLQDYIVERAGREDVPVIWNQDREGATSAVLELVLSAAERLQRV